jgi:hypothetical protein
MAPGLGHMCADIWNRIQNAPFRMYGDVAERLKAAVC